MPHHFKSTIQPNYGTKPPLVRENGEDVAKGNLRTIRCITLFLLLQYYASKEHQLADPSKLLMSTTSESGLSAPKQLSNNG
jgi:hypothetical protein